MSIDDLFSTIVKKLPVIRANDDFRADLDTALFDYLHDVSDTDMTAFLSEEEKYEIENNIKKLIDVIKAIILLHYDGLHGDALQLFQQQMNSEGGLLADIGIYSVKKTTEMIEKGERGESEKKEYPTFFYRARKFDDKRDHTFNEMFHIPLNLRGIVNTQRYSAPGYPCLYLGRTVFACWEEMNRPRFDDLMFSGFRIRRDFHVYDMRIPNKADFQENTLKNTLLRLPLIIACQVKVREREDTFKPEYIIPQFLMETIICNNRKQLATEKGPFDLVWGVLYTSTHVNNDFPYGVDYLENIVLPVVQSNHQSNYCNVLASLFDISDPLCAEYEELKTNSSRQHYDIEKQSIVEQAGEQYEQSKMGYLEYRIKRYGAFHTLNHFVPNTPSIGIRIPSDGSPYPVEIITNVAWTVS